LRDSEPGDYGTIIFEQHRNRLTNIAYGMLGAIMDAEDAVQDAWLRWRDIDATAIGNPGAYLTTITTRVAIDRLRSAQRRREAYVGPWLPEPVMTTFVPDPAEVVIGTETMTLALLTAIERLNPVERAVLLLRDVFDLEYSEIADVVNKSPANCRQIARRARDRAGKPKRPTQPDHHTEQRLLEAYVSAIEARDVAGLTELLAADVVLWADGGGKARAARHPLSGAARVARHLVGVTRRPGPDTEVTAVRVNGDPALLAVQGGRPVAILAFEIADAAIIAVRALLNPDKLGHVDLLDR
jgi:RNA polymerase sigma-70 factor (ECF subfamily)